MSGEDEWLFATGTRGESPMLLRLRSPRPSDEERAASPYLVLIRWPFDGDESHIPDEDDLDVMVNFEEALFAAMDAEGWGTGVAVVTSDGVREWRLYTPDIERFQEGMNDALAGLPRYPLEFATFDDPEWNAYIELESTLA